MVYVLRSLYTRGVAFDMEAFRRALRTARETHIGGREKLADKIDVSKSTVQNAEMGPDIPGIDTVARLIEGMGLTLSEFFAALEPNNDSVLPGADTISHSVRASPKEASHGSSGVSASLSEEDLATIFRALAERLGGSTLSAIERAQNRRQPANPRAKKTKSRKSA